MPVSTVNTKKQLLEELERRRKRAMRIGLIDNTSTLAGSMMRWYCLYCGESLGTTDPFEFSPPPSEKCSACLELMQHGWHDYQKPSFPFMGNPADPAYPNNLPRS